MRSFAVASAVLFAAPHAAAADATSATPLEITLPSRATLRTTQSLRARTFLRITAYSLRPGESLLLQQCGPTCSTARRVFEWEPADFVREPEQVAVIPETGHYYLWLRSETADNYVGTVVVESSSLSRANGIVRYASGTRLLIAVEPPP